MSALSTLSFVSLSAASRPHPSPATRNKTLTWFIDDTTRKGGIHLEQDDFHRDVIFMNQRRLMMMFRDSWMMVVGSLDILTWHLEMLRISGEGLEELEEGRMEIMGQYFMPGLRTNINPGCHCKNKQGHCLHFIAIFLRLQFSWHTIELWIKRTFSLLNFLTLKVSCYLSQSWSACTTNLMAVQQNTKLALLKLPLPCVKTGELHNLHSYPHLLSSTQGTLMVKTINYYIFLLPKVTHSPQLFMAVVSSIVQISVKVALNIGFVFHSPSTFKTLFDHFVSTST